MSYDNLSLGFNGTSRFSGQRGRTADGTGKSGIRYPSPFFDIAQTYMPPSTKGLLRWCRFYYLTNPLINATIHKMSEYPITEIIIDETDQKSRKWWETLLGRHLRYRAFQIEVGLDYYTYGICAVTIHFPFTKWLICSHCNAQFQASKTYYKWRNLNYVMECAKCGHVGSAIVQDWYEYDYRRIRLQRWNPEYMHVDPGFAGADPIYTFELPLQTRNDITIGKKNVLDTIPDVFVEAMRRNKFIAFAPENIFVLKRPIISQKDEGWGMPLILPVLRDSFYLQILRKAQEQIAQEHIVPLRILFPQAGSNSSDPYSTVNLEGWKTRIENEIAKWKYDNNYIPILPLPVGNETIGGDGKALGLYQEMDVWSKQIVAGMGVPQEFVFGGMQYSGSNVSMRMVENMFLGYRIDHENMLNEFVIRRIANYMKRPAVAAHMKRFKMADDLQRSTLYFQLNQAQKISDQTLLDEVDMDAAVEKQRKEIELDATMAYQRKTMIAQANAQAEVQVIQARAQAQAAAMAPQQPGQPGADPNAAAGAPGQPGQPGADGQQPTGQQGEMVDGQQVDPNMPQGSSVSMENAQQAPIDGVPLEAQSPLTLGQRGGGANLLYLAKRAAVQLKNLDQTTQTMELNRMKAGNPQLYQLVMQIMRSNVGSQANPLDAAQSPLPEQKPTRRQSPVGV